jgi:hypothetical protein
LSLDAPLVAVVWQVWFARCTSTPISWHAVGVLALTVWFIYVSDRLMDALPGASLHPAPRHLFYRRHWQLFACLAMVGLFALGSLCAYIQPIVLRNGFFLFSGVALYFSGIHFVPSIDEKHWPKEMAVGLIFALGTCLDVWTRMRETGGTLLVPMLLYATLCWLNCVGIEYWEWTRYRLSPQQAPCSLTIRVGANFQAVTLAVTGLAASLWASSFWMGGSISYRPIFLACLISSATLLLLARQSQRLSSDALRVLVDISLLSPLLFLIPQAILAI